MRPINLIVTCARHMEDESAEEIRSILEKMGDQNPVIKITGISGILTVVTSIDPFFVPGAIRKMLVEEPWTIRHCMRVIPVQKTVKTDLGEIVIAASKLVVERLAADHTYKIHVEKRNTELSSLEIIEAVSIFINNEVSLERPDRIILIEILGGMTGVSLLEEQDIFSAEKTRRMY